MAEDNLGLSYRGREGSGLAQVLPTNNTGLALLKGQGDMMLRQAIAKTKEKKDEGEKVDALLTNIDKNLITKDHEQFSNELNDLNKRIMQRALQSGGKVGNDEKLKFSFELQDLQSRVQKASSEYIEYKDLLDRIKTDPNIDESNRLRSVKDIENYIKETPVGERKFLENQDWLITKNPRNWSKVIKDEPRATNVSTLIDAANNRTVTQTQVNAEMKNIEKQFDDVFSKTEYGKRLIGEFAFETPEYKNEMKKNRVTIDDMVNNPDPAIQNYLTEKKEEFKKMYTTSIINDLPVQYREGLLDKFGVGGVVDSKNALSWVIDEPSDIDKRNTLFKTSVENLNIQKTLKENGQTKTYKVYGIEILPKEHEEGGNVFVIARTYDYLKDENGEYRLDNNNNKIVDWKGIERRPYSDFSDVIATKFKFITDNPIMQKYITINNNKQLGTVPKKSGAATSKQTGINNNSPFKNLVKGGKKK